MLLDNGFPPAVAARSFAALSRWFAVGLRLILAGFGDQLSPSVTPLRRSAGDFFAMALRPWSHRG